VLRLLPPGLVMLLLPAGQLLLLLLLLLPAALLLLWLWQVLAHPGADVCQVLAHLLCCCCFG
jgi:hypothetical protein